MIVTLTCPTVTDTRAAAGRLAALLRPGDVVVLAGPLGCGKTTFAGGLADGLGVEEPVTSPSFILMRRYDSGFLPMVHVDVYRLGTVGEFEDLEVLEEGRDGVVVIEWGNAVLPLLPDDHLVVEFDVQPGGTRILRLVPSGDWKQRPLEEVEG